MLPRILAFAFVHFCYNILEIETAGTWSNTRRRACPARSNPLRSARPGHPAAAVGTQTALTSPYFHTGGDCSDSRRRSRQLSGPALDQRVSGSNLVTSNPRCRLPRATAVRAISDTRCRGGARRPTICRAPSAQPRACQWRSGTRTAAADLVTEAMSAETCQWALQLEPGIGPDRAGPPAQR